MIEFQWAFLGLTVLAYLLWLFSRRRQNSDFWTSRWQRVLVTALLFQAPMFITSLVWVSFMVDAPGAFGGVLIGASMSVAGALAVIALIDFVLGLLEPKRSGLWLAIAIAIIPLTIKIAGFFVLYVVTGSAPRMTMSVIPTLFLLAQAFFWWLHLSAARVLKEHHA